MSTSNFYILAKPLRPDQLSKVRDRTGHGHCRLADPKRRPNRKNVCGDLCRGRLSRAKRVWVHYVPFLWTRQEICNSAFQIPVYTYDGL